MSSSKNEDDDLPDGWVECHSKSNPGRMYFFNKKTGKSSWTKPQVEEKRRFTKKVQKEKSKKEETVKRDLKRKSDTQYDETTPKKRTSRVSETPTPEAKKQTKETPPSKPPASTKNSANKRLQLLRKRLSEETNKEEQSDPAKDKEQMKSPSKFRKDPQKVSPKAETPKSSKSNASDLKSPNLNESRCSTAQSPSSDSLQSIPSPSQFFAANKILSSMKAQLPEEYHHKMKAKDMFADIDQAICNQTPEYPSTKHPATPPQFSEASKIVSAIKSKLAFKSLTHFDSVNVKAYSSAKERLEALRTSLTKEADAETKDCDSEFVNIEIKTAKQSPVENMEVEDCKQPKPSPQKSQYSSTNSKENDKDNVILVVDTNIFIHELDVIKNVLNSRINGYTEQPMLLVPWRVISELDRLKDNNNGNGAICKRARAAMDYLYQSLPENNRIKGQSLRDANSHIYPCEVPDDEILNCCLQQSERGKSVILLSNDKNLCSKAIINGVKCIGLNDLKGLLEDKRTESPDPDLQSSLKHYQATLYQLLANILENEMRAKYATLWQHVLFKAPPWTLRDVLQCLLKHWLAVFSEVFPRIEHLITELKNCVTSLEARGPNSLRSSEVDNFKELSLEVASKCQIIPEYMELAKKTVERLTQRPTAAVDEIAVIEAFETVWTVFSSYCAKLASGLGLSHDVEDKINSEEPLSVLTSKWNVFSSHIYDFTRCIQGILDTDEADPDFIEHLARLEAVFKSSLALISIDCSAVDADSLRLFCTKCRNMLQEAYVKFAHLTQLLDACRDTLKK